MKPLILGATVTLTIASFASAAYANHPFNPGPVTTGGAYMQRYTEYLREHNNPTQSTSSSDQQKTYDTSVLLKQSTGMNQAASKDCPYIAPVGTTGGAVRQQLDAIARCNSGR